jgi:anti-sigma factor RsiW
MSAHDATNRDDVPPELLAAYVDGELAPAECRRVEAWLAAHPEARADVEAQRRLARLLDESAPAAPAEEQWADVLARMERGLAVPSGGPTGGRRRAAVVAAAVVAAAAAVLLAVALNGLPVRPVLPGDTPQEDEEPWPVASADEVEVLSMDDRDRGTLVVGEPPVNVPVELVTAKEVQVNKLEPDEQGRVGRLYGMGASGSPIVIMPLEGAPEDDP